MMRLNNKYKYKHKQYGSNSGSISVEFIIIIPVLLSLFLFSMELSKYWSEKYLFRVDVYYLTRSLTMSSSKINTSYSDQDSFREKNDSGNTQSNSNKVSNLIHKDKYLDVCSRISKYKIGYNVECKYENKTVYIKAYKLYQVKFFISRILFDIASIINSRPTLDIYEYQTFRIDSFLEDSHINWSGNIIGVSSFNNNPKLKEWIVKLADIYNEVTTYAQKYPNTAVKKGDL